MAPTKVYLEKWLAFRNGRPDQNIQAMTMVDTSGNAVAAPPAVVPLGEAAMVGSMPVVVASDQTPFPTVGVMKSVDVVSALSVAAAYVANDFVGTSATPMTFADCARVNGGSGRIVGALLMDKVIASVAGELWLFDTAVTPPNDSAAFAISDAHAARCIGVIPFSTYYASANNSVSPKPDQNIPFTCLGGSKDLYGCFVTRGAPAYVGATDLVFRLFIEQY
jgi:hypothetical protein